MITKQHLIEARSLIEKPESWTKGAFARDASGDKVTIASADATCFCLVGAIARVAILSPFRMTNFLGPSNALVVNLINFNDSHTHGEVLARLDQLIENISETPLPKGVYHG